MAVVHSNPRLGENKAKRGRSHDSTLIRQYSPRDSDGVLPLFTLNSQTGIVSGADDGIGLAVVGALAEAGAKVRAETIGKKLGVKAAAYQVDVISQKAVQEAVGSVVSEFRDRLDIKVANYGIPWTRGAMLDTSEEGFDHYRKIITTDVDSHFRHQGSGSFISTANMSGHIAIIPELQTTVFDYLKGLSVHPGHIPTKICDFVPDETKDIWKVKIPFGKLSELPSSRERLVNPLKGAYLYLASDAAAYTLTDIIVD
ncbi:hypothetical protein B9Z19DRAFT_1113746 [Tuber borchii]|uniref:Uncharacterized protein n=1 Tax=Tuber borchii TaxID=42251 RepID=A0A2T6ZZ54_TUBBO|nr:hypothetical protein B9Z19DRAFT_1113746 [Tuber borchii]